MSRRGALAVLVVLSVLIGGCTRPAPTAQEPATPPSAEATTPSLRARDTKRFKQWARKQRRYSTVAEAQKDLPFNLQMPDPSLVPTPTTIHGSEGKNSTRAAYVYFGDTTAGDAIHFIATRSQQKPDLRKQVDQAREDRADGILMANTLPQLVSVNGTEGIGVEPGINEGGRVRIDMKDRPGFVSWWDGGVHYILYGTEGPEGTPLAQLLTIANSMH